MEWLIPIGIVIIGLAIKWAIDNDEI